MFEYVNLILDSVTYYMNWLICIIAQYISGGQLTLPESDFLPLCKSGLILRVTLDTTNRVTETNELDNEAEITNIAITGTGTTCTSKFTAFVYHSVMTTI